MRQPITMFPLFTGLCLALACLGPVSSLKLASKYFPICHRSDPELPTCIQKGLEALRPRLVKGIPELKILPLDPLYVTKLDIQDGATNFKYHVTMSDINIHGLQSFKIKSVQTDMKKDLITVVFVTDKMDFDGDYEMEGQLLSVDLKGKGHATMNFTTITTEATIEGEVYTKKGVEYYGVKNLKWQINPENARFHFTNLFDGDKTLGDAANRFLNENWRDAMDIYRTLPENAFSKLLKDRANYILAQFPKKEFFPE